MLPVPVTAVTAAACLMNVRRELAAADWSLSWLMIFVLLSFATLDTFVGKSKLEMNSGAVFFVLTDERTRWPSTGPAQKQLSITPKKRDIPVT